MANTSKSKLSASTRNAVSALDWAVQNLQPEGVRPEEFTSAEYLQRLRTIEGREITSATAYNLLARAVERKELVVRQGKGGGRRINFYSRPQ